MGESNELNIMYSATIFKELTFDSAHFLPNVPEGHKCRNIHGHTYRLKVYINGPIDEHTGWVADFAELKKSVKSVIEEVDHKFLNNIDGLDNPTCELLARWLWQKIKPLVPGLSKIELHETPTSGVVYRE